MAALPENLDALHHHPLVQADRPQVGRLADHRGATQRPPAFGEGTGAGHRAFLVAGGEDHQRLAERLVEQRQQGLDGQREEALHVATAEAVPAAVALVQAQRIAAPQRFVVGHGIGVAGQHQPAGTAAVAGQQVELARRDFPDLAAEA